jgi:hypothetical protein
MKRLFLVLALVFTVQAQEQEQDELPTPEAFAKDCLNSMFFFVQQTTEAMMKVEGNLDDLDPQIKNDILTALSRGQIKQKSCNSMAKFLGEDYAIHLAKIYESSEIKMAMYNRSKEVGNIKLSDTQDRAEETKEELIASVLADLYLNSLRDDYVLAIQQKVGHNWIKPVGSRKMPLSDGVWKLIPIEC